jgi:hypothetical protein
MAQLWSDGCTANALLSDHFDNAIRPPGNLDLFKEWAMCVPAAGLPPNASSTSCTGRFYLPNSTARRPFLFNSKRFDQPSTAAAPPIQEQVSDYHQASVHDILTQEALREIYHWFRRELNDLLACLQDRPHRHCTNKVLVIDQSGFLPQARGLFWDLTTDPQSLMRRSHSAVPRLIAAAILAAAGADYPDKELLYAIQHGVCMPTDFQLLNVLNPCLLSLAYSMPQIAADIARMEAGGMLTVHTFLQFVQGVLLPQGTTGKQNEQTQRCLITDAGAPRAPLTSRDGTQVVPINDCVRVPLPDGRSQMQSEEKPASDVTVNDCGNLAYVTRAMALDGFTPDEYFAYLACDDFKAFFNQFTLHPSEWSRFCLAFLCDWDLYVASERVLGFCCAPSSGIVQRFAHLVREMVTECMIAADAPFVAGLRSWACTHLRTWFAQQDALSSETSHPQVLFFHIGIYTDDAGKGAVNCARMQRFIAIWTETCEVLGIECAAAHKQSLGTFVLSLCVVLCHRLRGVLIPTAKVLSASSDLSDVHSSELNQFSKCRKVFGLVGHFCDALGIPRATMYGMYSDFREGSKDPNALIRASPATIAACGCICGSFSPEHRCGHTSFTRQTQVSIYTDASEEGLCCFCHGHYFKVGLSLRWATLPMAVLEFVAFFGGVIAFGCMVLGFKVLLLTDSTAVQYIASQGIARSELMQMVHTWLLDAP